MIVTVGYSFTAWSLARNSSFTEKRDWKWFALGALLHVSVIVHSARNMQPLNDKLAAFARVGTDGKGTGSVKLEDEGRAVEIATKWIRGNYYRILIPTVTGCINLYQTIFATR
jgi:hypothetical protein